MKRMLLLTLILPLTNGFMFDQLSDKLRCRGISMLCPPVCLKQDSSGCSTCDCSNIDPSHPKIPGSGDTAGSHVDPSNPLSGLNNIPGSAVCSDWTKCACVPIVNAATGCLECRCGQTQVTRPTFSKIQLTQPETTTKHSTVVTTMKTFTTNTGKQQNTQTSSYGSMGTSTSSHASVAPSYVTSSTTSQPANYTTSANAKTSVLTSAKVTSSKMDTNLPNIATVPSMNTFTTVLTTSALAPFVCLGVFSCSLDCYSGYVIDKNGCPLCQCAPVPTDLP